MGSASEVKYFILLARDLGYLNPSSYEALMADIGEIKRMLSALIARLKADG